MTVFPQHCAKLQESMDGPILKILEEDPKAFLLLRRCPIFLQRLQQRSHKNLTERLVYDF
jgi:hypothetical protein